MITLEVPASITDADDIINIISKWVQSNPSVTVNKATLDIDCEHPSMLDSVNSVCGFLKLAKSHKYISTHIINHS